MQAFFEKFFGFFEIFFRPRKSIGFSIVISVFFALWNSFHFLVFCRFLWYNKCAAALRAFLGRRYAPAGLFAPGRSALSAADFLIFRLEEPIHAIFR